MNHTNNVNETEYQSRSEDRTSIDAIDIINCALNAPLMLISILGNALVLAAIIRTPSMRSPSMIMLSSLTVSDLLVGFIAQPLFIAKEVTNDSDSLVYHLSQTTGVSLCGVSLGTKTAITVDRLMSLHFHMRYSSLVTKSRIRCTVVTIWLTNLFLSSFHIWNESVFNLLTAALTIICLVISTVCYVRIYGTVRQHQLQIHSQEIAVQMSNGGNNLNIAKMRRSTANVFMLYIVLLLCYFPSFLLLALYEASCKKWEKEWNFATTVVFMSSSVNPFLYCWRLGELRKAVIKTARHIVCTQTDQSQN